ncbi:MAG: LCP family protein [Candidatus Colwellbacteria bacterium]|nr:LCP family protein [Candidatus Colwellbacteria bacterium]
MIRKTLLVLVGLITLAGIVFVTRGFLAGERVVVVNRDGEFEDQTGDISILVLGQVGAGQGGRWHAAPNLTDAIILLHYKQESNAINLISLPRDMYGKFGKGYSKLNQLYEEDKTEDLFSGITAITGINVNKYLVVDLEIVSKAIDSLGGIDIDLPSKVVDSVSGFTLEAGPQRLKGEIAVWLIRNRYAPEGDFFREKNQHLVIQAAFNKFDNLSAWGKTAVMFGLLPEMNKSTSNFSMGDVFYEFGNIEDVGFNSVVLDFDTGLLVSDRVTTTNNEEMYVLIPSEGINEYGKIQDFINEEIL